MPLAAPETAILPCSGRRKPWWWWWWWWWWRWSSSSVSSSVASGAAKASASCESLGTLMEARLARMQAAAKGGEQPRPRCGCSGETEEYEPALKPPPLYNPPDWPSRKATADEEYCCALLLVRIIMAPCTDAGLEAKGGVVPVRSADAGAAGERGGRPPAPSLLCTFPPVARRAREKTHRVFRRKKSLSHSLASLKLITPRDPPRASKEPMDRASDEDATCGERAKEPLENIPRVEGVCFSRMKKIF